MPAAERPRRILLADCDSYFVRCAMLADPEGAGKADLLLVGGSPTGRGVVTSASYGARRFGAHAGMPMASALRLCPQAMVVPVPGEMVGRKHREVRAVLEEFAPVVEAASVDEFYLDLTGTEELYRHEPLEATARRIQAAVLERTGISLSIGAATQRTLAKMAASVNKPYGVHVVPPGAEAEFIRGFALADVPGVGPSFAEALRRRGATRVSDLAQLDEATLVAWVGESRGRWLHRLAHGRDASGISARAPQKSISHERTFARDLTAEEEIETRLLMLVTETGAGLRDEGLKARTVTVRLRYADFTDRSASRTVPQPLESDRALYAVARALLRQLRARRRGGIRLLGVGVSKLGTDAEADPVLFPPEGAESERDRRLSAASDRLRGRFGKGAVVPARIAPRRDGKD
ncbi:MAG TPA: DNA polymerase IV [Longimicrobiaceae bacterium]|nr:DNA polymerase IV [Longimicrobiaceae bacterium]